MMYKYTRLVLWLAAFIPLLAGCAVEDPVPVAVEESFIFWEDEQDIDSWGGYMTLYLAVENGLHTVSATADADWLTVMGETLPADGILELKSASNPGEHGRSATLCFTAYTGIGTRQCELTVYQKGTADYDTNACVVPAYEDFRVGWGYCAFDEFESLGSVRKPVIDLDAMQGFDGSDTFCSVQESLCPGEDFDVMSAYTLQEMSAQLTKSMDRTIKFLGMRKTTTRYTKISTTDTHEQYYGYARLTKKVLRRNLDQGALDYVIRAMADRHYPFTEAFRSSWTAVMTASSDERMDQAVKSMVAQFGTHIVTDAVLGGSVDYLVTFDMHRTVSLEQMVETHASKVFGKTSASSSSSSKEKVTSDIAHDDTFRIAGGDPDAVKALRTNMKQLTSGSSISPDLLMKWEQSIKADSPVSRKNLEPVEFTLYPIWKLFPDTHVKERIMKVVMEMSEQSNNAFTDRELGLDNYHVPLEGFTFGPSDESRVKLLYSDGEPVLQACLEYVPKIRGDRPVTVYYPVRGGKVRIGQGLFPGDGEGHPPAYLNFSGGDVFVDPIDDLPEDSGTPLSNVYLIGGNLYASDYSTPTKSIGQTEVRPEFFSLAFVNKWDGRFFGTMVAPVVKIGSGYWCSESVNNDVGDILFEGVRGANNVFYMAFHPVGASGPLNPLKLTDASHSEWHYAEEGGSRYCMEDDEYGNRSGWFIPRTSDCEELIRYVGNNTKVLFQGQASGFNAIFDGCYIGDPYLDHPGSAPAGANRVWHEGSKSFLITYDLPGGFHTYLLTPDYRWEVDSGADEEERKAGVDWLDHLYPVRLFHDQGYVYPGLDR